MDQVEAVRQIAWIRETMERSSRYSSYSGVGAILSGLLALVGAGLSFGVHLKVGVLFGSALGTWALIWLLVFTGALMTNITFTTRKARRLGVEAWTPKTRRIIFSMLPAFVLAACWTAALVLSGRLDTIPAAWMSTYGLSLCAASAQGVPEARPLGYLFVITGAVGLFLPLSFGLGLLALSFGGYHLVYGGYVYAKLDG